LDYSSVSNGPYRVALGDIDGDGLSDLVIANYQGNSCAVRRNQTTGDTLGLDSFSAEADLATGILPVSLTLADIDGDGLLDIVIGHQFSSYVSVYRNRSVTGIVDFDSRFDVPATAGFLSVAVADIDGDGRPDLAIANREANAVTVHRNTGSPGTLGWLPGEPVGTGTGAVSLIANDWDRDGKPDLAFVDGGGTKVSVLRNLSSPGVFEFAPRQAFAVPSPPSAVMAGDMTDDGVLDAVVVSEASGFMSVLPGLSSPGTIAFGTRVEFRTAASPCNLALGDIDGDGKVDVAVVSSVNPEVVVHRNTAVGGMPSFDPGIPFAIATASLSAALGDLTANTKPELVAANIAATSVSVLRNAVLPPPRIDIAPTILLYPDVAVGDSIALVLTVRNLSPAPLTLTSVFAGSTPFHPVVFLPAVIPGNDSLLIPVRFTPLTFGFFSDTLHLHSNGGDTSAVLTGASPFPVLQGLPDTVDFGSVPEYAVETRLFSVTNSSVNRLRIDSILFRPPFSALFPDSSVGKTDTTIAKLQFQPAGNGTFFDSIVVVTNGSPSRRPVYARGRGLDIALIPVGMPWSLVSVPRIPQTYAADTLFPGKIGIMFAFLNVVQNYDPVTVLAHGPGYWVKHDSPDTMALAGSLLDSINVPAAREGWVLFGSITRPVLVSTISTVPGNAIISPVFRFNILSQLYEPAAEIRPGEGYWVKVDRPCRIHIH
jgi:hypothetical protein